MKRERLKLCRAQRIVARVVQSHEKGVGNQRVEVRFRCGVHWVGQKLVKCNVYELF
jgi:hypothetical protein